MLPVWCSTNRAIKSARCVCISWWDFGSIGEEGWIFRRGKVEDFWETYRDALPYACLKVNHITWLRELGYLKEGLQKTSFNV